MYPSDHSSGVTYQRLKKKVLKQSFYGIKCLGGFNILLPESLCLYWGHHLTLLSGQGQLQVLLLEGAACSLSNYRQLFSIQGGAGEGEIVFIKL